MTYETAAAQEVHLSLRAAPYAMMAPALVGFFGSGIALVRGSCGNKGVFGSCHDKSKSNAEKIQKLADFTEALAEDVFILRTEVHGKFFMVKSDFPAIETVQKGMLEVQNRNVQIISSISRQYSLLTRL